MPLVQIVRTEAKRRRILQYKFDQYGVGFFQEWACGEADRHPAAQPHRSLRALQDTEGLDGAELEAQEQQWDDQPHPDIIVRAVRDPATRLRDLFTSGHLRGAVLPLSACVETRTVVLSCPVHDPGTGKVGQPAMDALEARCDHGQGGVRGPS